MKKITLTLLIVFSFYGINTFAQNPPKKDKGIFKEYKGGYYKNTILKSIKEFNEKDKIIKSNKSFNLDFTGKDIPNSVGLYKKNWYNKPISQGNAGTCWCYSTTSFFESEIYRQTKQKVKLSEIYTVYCEYVEKARRFVKERGNSAFEQGSESNSVTRMWKKYGVIPYKDYTGLKPGQQFHSHAKMYKEMKSYLNSVKEKNAWNEQEVISTIKSIMNHYIGEPPTEITVNDKTMTPKQYLKDVLKLNPDDYIDVMSLKEKPYYEKVEYEVTDNWWHSKEYYNIPLNEWMNIINKSIRKGYTIAIGGDVSEAGFDRDTHAAVVPDFDIPSDYIDEDARQFRFSNKTTTDDHGMHLVGYLEKDGKNWYLIKDSSSGSRNGDVNGEKFGYYFFSEDYMKLKIIDFAVHKDMVKDILKKMK